MKNYLLLTASAVLVLSSCSNNEIVENNDLKNDEPKTMKFQTYVPGATRAIWAEEAIGENVRNNGFYLWTNQTKVVNGEEEQVEGLMTFDGEREWVMGDEQLQWSTDLNAEVTFYAGYSNNGSDDLYVSDEADFGGMVLGGINVADGDNDYMFAADTASYNKANGNVTLNFSHILSQVEVRVGGTTENYNYEVAGVVLSAPYSNYYHIADKAFVVQDEETTDYELYDGISADGVTVADALAVGLLEKYAEQEQVYSKIMVVPGECSLRLKYRIYADGENPGWSSIGYEDDDQSFTFNVQAGYRNIVNVKLNPATRAMTFSVDVVTWTDAQDENNLDL